MLIGIALTELLPSFSSLRLLLFGSFSLLIKQLIQFPRHIKRPICVRRTRRARFLLLLHIPRHRALLAKIMPALRDYRPLIVLLADDALEWNLFQYLLPVSYTHLTLPTKRIV